MLIYACLPDYSKYKDRYQMFMAMCRHGIRVRMITLHGVHPESSELPEGFEPLLYSEGKGFISRGRFMRANILPAEGEKTIIHDTFIAQMGLFVRNRWKLRHKNSLLRNVLSLYSPSSSFLFGGHWQGNGEFKVGIDEMPYYIRKYLPITIMEMLSCRFADIITGNTEGIVEDVQKYYRIPAERTKFISSEIDCDYYCPGPSCRKELNLPQEDKIMLYVGNFQRRKGVDIILRAAAIAASQIPNIRLVFLGRLGDTEKVWFEKLLREPVIAGRVQILPSVDSNKLRDYYRSCDLLILPTRHEGSPRVVKEAMACGCPVVASRVPGTLAIDSFGESIIYADSWEASEYAKLILNVVSKPDYVKQRIKAGLRIIQSLSVDAVAQRYVELYNSLY